MKILGVPLIYIVIAVGVLGIATYSYVSYNKTAFIADDTLKCQRTYDFSQVKFTPEAKQDWDKCYMPQPLYERNSEGQVKCVYYPEETCGACAGVLAVKYNNSNYCEIMSVCGDLADDVEYCKKVVAGYSGPVPVAVSRIDVKILRRQVDLIYPNKNN